MAPGKIFSLAGIVRYKRDVKRALAQQGLIIFGALVTALGYSLFQVPFDITAGGLSGLAIIVNHYTGWWEGAIFFLLNIPLLVLGFYQLGRWRLIASAGLSLVVFSMATDFFTFHLPDILENYPITDNILMAALYAGVTFGLGNGLIFRAGGSFPGTTILGRIIQRRTGIPLSQTFLYTDSLIVISAGFVFGWELALLALISLFFSGLAADFMLEGTSQGRTAMIVTNHPGELQGALMQGLHRGVSQWEIQEGSTGAQRTMLYCTIYRSQVQELKHIISSADPEAFTVIGVAQQAFGGTRFSSPNR